MMRGWCGSELVGECARACSTAAEGAQGFKGVDIGLNTEARVAAQIYLQQHSTSASSGKSTGCGQVWTEPHKFIPAVAQRQRQQLEASGGGRGVPAQRPRLGQAVSKHATE